MQLQFSVTGFYQPSTMTVLGPAVRFTAESIEAGKQLAYETLLELSAEMPDKYPSPENRPDWPDVFFHHLSDGENPARDLGLTAGNYRLLSFVKYSDGPRKSPDIYFFATPATATEIGRELLEMIYKEGYRSFPNPITRPDWAEYFLKKA